MYLLLAVFVIVSISTSALPESLLKGRRLVNVPLHATIEALGGLSAVVIALFLLQRQEEAYSAKRFPLAMGFLGAPGYVSCDYRARPRVCVTAQCGESRRRQLLCPGVAAGPMDP